MKEITIKSNTCDMTNEEKFQIVQAIAKTGMKMLVVWEKDYVEKDESKTIKETYNMTHEERISKYNKQMMNYYRQGKTHDEALVLIEQEEIKNYVFEARNNLFKTLNLQMTGDEQSDLNLLHKVLGINKNK